MDAVFDILWWLWCPVAALLVQAVAIRLYRPRNAVQETTVGCLGGVDKLAMLGEQVSLRMIDRAAIPINFTL